MTAAKLPDSLREALGQVIANERREWRRERELIQAQANEIVADLRARIVELERKVDGTVSARLADVRDGVDGKDGQPGAAGAAGAPGERGLPGERGEAGPRGERGADGVPGEPGATGKDGRDGVDGKDGAPGRDGADGLPGERGMDGKDGAPGADGRDGAPGRDGKDGVDGINGKDGAPGERGPEGPPGKLPVVKAWAEGVHYEGDVRTYRGGLYQALKDTGQEPGGADWCCLATAGQDGRSIDVRGTYDAEGQYKRLDVVALNGGSFVALKDAPGPCPGDGWQLLASQGRRGKDGPPGARGERGLQGERGEPGASHVGWKVDARTYVAVPVMSDGSEGAPLELRGLFEQFESETR